MSLGTKHQFVRAAGTVLLFGALGVAALTMVPAKAKSGEYLGRIGSNPFCSDCTANPSRQYQTRLIQTVRETRSGRMVIRSRLTLRIIRSLRTRRKFTERRTKSRL